MFPQRLILAGFVAVASQGWCLAANQFVQHNLVSDLAGLADHQDANLVNAWGICASASSPFWISDNGTGVSTLYDGSGTVIPLVVNIPVPAGIDPPGAPSGCIFNQTQAFMLNGKPASFIFSTEQGTIVAWNGSAGGTGVIVADNSASGAVYKGLTIAARASGPTLYAANFNAGTVDMWDGNLNWVSLPGAFSDPSIPKGFAPFNIQSMNNLLYVTYAKQDDEKHDDVAGPGNGYVDVYNSEGFLYQKLVAGGALNSPWGMAIAPPLFGNLSNAILVGNFGDGRINAYSFYGQWMGDLKDTYGNDIQISGLWGLMVGNGGKGGDNGSLYFTAGIAGPDTVESHGLFGVLQPDPAIASVFQSASYMPAISPGAFGSVKGTALAATTRNAGAADTVNGQLPIALDGVTVTVDGRPAYLDYISPKQINFIAPPDTNWGQVPVVVYNNEVASAAGSVWLQPYAPGFFLNGVYVTATHADGSLVGATTLDPGKSTPAKPGETIVLYGTGFGPTNPPMDGRVLYEPVPAEKWPVVTIGGLPATVTWAGLSSAGTYQIDVTVPAIPAGSTPTVDVPVSATVGGIYMTQSGVLLTVMPGQ
jgi:uncharacterized protein (TIGR03118 family)